MNGENPCLKARAGHTGPVRRKGTRWAASELGMVVRELGKQARAPQKVSTWVRDFARAFHGFYRDCRVLSPDAGLTQARLWLAEASRIGLANALGLLGVSAPSEMTRLDDDDDSTENE